MRLTLYFCLLMMIFSLPFLSGLKADSQDAAAFPNGIVEFYRDYNFLSSFTTKAERLAMADYLEYGQLPEAMDSERMQDMFDRMKRIMEKIFIVDSEMVIPRPPSFNWKKYVFRSELYEIEDIRRRRDQVYVDVKAYELEPEEIMRYLSEYEKNKGDLNLLPSEQERLRQAKTRVMERKEVHTWILQHNKWLKTDSNYIFIKK